MYIQHVFPERDGDSFGLHTNYKPVSIHRRYVIVLLHHMAIGKSLSMYISYLFCQAYPLFTLLNFKRFFFLLRFSGAFSDEFVG